MDVKISMNAKLHQAVHLELFAKTSWEHLFANVHLVPMENLGLAVPNPINVSAMPFVLIP
jgi:hypothetical protein